MAEECFMCVRPSVAGRYRIDLGEKELTDVLVCESCLTELQNIEWIDTGTSEAVVND